MPPRASGKEAFAGCQVMGHPAKKLKKNKKILCRVPNGGTRQRLTAAGRRQAGHLCRRPYFAEWPASGKDQFLPTAGICRVPGTRQRLLCRRPLFAGCCQAWHPAKNSFAGCPIKSTRQIFLLSANQPFPVVVVVYYHRK